MLCYSASNQVTQYQKKDLENFKTTTTFAFNDKKVHDFQIHLSKIIKLWRKDSFCTIKNEEDELFLKSIMTNGVASHSKVDKVTQQKYPQEAAT